MLCVIGDMSILFNGRAIAIMIKGRIFHQHKNKIKVKSSEKLHKSYYM